MLSKIHKVNNWLAIKSTLAVGSMWCAYLFLIIGTLRLFSSDLMNEIAYWGTIIQLLSIPLILVGTNLLDRSAERRSKETHKCVMDELKIIKEQHELLKHMHAESDLQRNTLHTIINDLYNKLNKD